MSSLLLDTVAWDLCVDASGNIAVASEPYSLAQDAACAIRLFRGELWYDTTQGVPYWGQILGQWPPVAVMKAAFITAALTVTGVVSAQCYIDAVTDRAVTGQVQVTGSSGVVGTSSFTHSPPPVG